MWRFSNQIVTNTELNNRKKQHSRQKTWELPSKKEKIEKNGLRRRNKIRQVERTQVGVVVHPMQKLSWRQNQFVHLFFAKLRHVRKLFEFLNGSWSMCQLL